MLNTVKPTRRRVSLTVRFSLILIFAVVIPLVITVLSSEFILRPTLSAQAQNEMRDDAVKHAKEIDVFLQARSQELGLVYQLKAIREFAAGNELYRDQAANELKVGRTLNIDYINWALFNAQGNYRLADPVKPDQHGKYLIPPALLQQVQKSNTTVISDVYYNSAVRQAYVDIYTRINDSNGAIRGIGRASLSLNSIWTTVNNEYNAGTQNYATVIDNHGMRIAYTNPDTTLTTLPATLFQSIATLPADFQQRVQDEDLYGNSFAKVGVTSDPGMAQLVAQPATTSVSTFTPGEQKEDYQVVEAKMSVLPWSYIVLRPVRTITAAANQQIFYLIVIAAVVTALAAIIGLWIGRSVTRPIQLSVNTLRENSDALRSLAQTEESTAMEQKWIIDSSQVGLQSVQYYANASSSAAQQLNQISENLLQNWNRMDAAHTKQSLDDIIAAARYLEKAAEHEKKSCNGLADAIQVTAQVTDQLVSGATSASTAASQLDTVVEQLRDVVGN